MTDHDPNSQVTREKDSTVGGQLIRIAKAVAIVGLLLLAITVVIAILRPIAYYKLVEHLVESVSGLTGLNQYLVTAVAVATGLPFIIAIRFVIAPPKKWHRPAGLGVMAAYITAYNIALYAITGDQYFRVDSDAEAIKWYAITPNGVDYFDRPGTHPVYGIPLQPVTPDAIAEHKLHAVGEASPVDAADVQFFDPMTGAPKAWYTQESDGRLSFFDRPGFDPRSGVRLQGVTPSIAAKWMEQQGQNERKKVFLEQVRKGSVKPIDPAQAEFFDPESGEAAVWYGRAERGVLEFYDRPGFDPLTGDRLRPVTASVVAEWKESEAQRRESERQAADIKARSAAEAARRKKRAELRALVNSVSVARGRRSVAVIAQAGRSSNHNDQALARGLAGTMKDFSPEVDVVEGLFRRQFTAEGWYERALGGDVGFLAETGAFDAAESVLLVRVSGDCRPSPRSEGVHLCAIRFESRVAYSGGSSTARSGTVSGSGFSDAAALERALEVLVETELSNLTNTTQARR